MTKQKINILSTGVDDETLAKVKKRIGKMEIQPTVSSYLKHLILRDLEENGGESNEST